MIKARLVFGVLACFGPLANISGSLSLLYPYQPSAEHVMARTAWKADFQLFFLKPACSEGPAGPSPESLGSYTKSKRIMRSSLPKDQGLCPYFQMPTGLIRAKSDPLLRWQEAVYPATKRYQRTEFLAGLWRLTYPSDR